MLTATAYDNEKKFHLISKRGECGKRKSMDSETINTRAKIVIITESVLIYIPSFYLLSKDRRSDAIFFLFFCKYEFSFCVMTSGRRKLFDEDGIQFV